MSFPHTLFRGGLPLLAALAATQLPAQTTATPAETGWPRQFFYSGDSITIYQPQVTAWQDNLIRGHAAVSIKAPGMAEPTFGVIQVQGVTAVNKDTRLVDVSDIALTNAKFPMAGTREQEFTAALTLVLPVSYDDVSLDRLTLSLAANQSQQTARAVPILNDPPKIIFASQPSILVTIDGAPKYVAVTGQPVMRVVNTAVFLARDDGDAYWLHVYDGFMTAPALAGPWTVAKKVPSAVQTAAQAAAKSGQVDMLTGATSDSTPTPTLKNTTPPAIYVATSPTELIVTDGPPNYEAIPGHQPPVRLEHEHGRLRGGQHADRLRPDFRPLVQRALTLQGPWTFVPADSLPGEFAQIPYDSPMENVLASVPGTPQAQEAVIENGVPQTATVYRDSAHLDQPIYDGGTPQLQAIAGTPLQYVVNTGTPVIMVSGSSWYALQSGIWFTSTSANGPWTVATSVPATIYSIPPSSPIYYVTYVKVYSATPTVVYVGYTPGYYGAYITPYGTVVYGTGYAYPAYVGTVYYPPPMTYGYGATMTYTPYAGWGFAFALGYAAGSSYYHYGYAPMPYYGAYSPYHGYAYGPYGGAAYYGPGGWAGTTGNVYHQYGSTSAVSRTSGGYNAYTGNAYAHQTEQSYNSMTGTSTVGARNTEANAYTGNYASQSAGAARNDQTGAAAAGVHTTQGNAYTGQQVSATKGAVYNPNTGKTESVGAMGSDGNYVAHAGNNVYAEDNGNVYKSTPSGWQQPSASGGWQQSNMSDAQKQQANGWSNATGAGDTRAASSGNFNRGYGGGGGFGGGGGRRR